MLGAVQLSHVTLVRERRDRSLCSHEFCNSSVETGVSYDAKKLAYSEERSGNLLQEWDRTHVLQMLYGTSVCRAQYDLCRLRKAPTDI